MNYSLFFVIALALFLLTSQETFKISCAQMEQCTKNGYIYSLLQTNQTKQICTQESICPFQQIEVEIFQCPTAINGKTCYSGICYYIRDITDCVDEYFKECTIPERTKIQCGDCKQNSCDSQKCTIYNGGQQCNVGGNCEVKQFYIEKQLCEGKKNYLGETCFCCGRYLIEGNSGKCLDGVAFNSQILEEWAVGFKNSYELGKMLGQFLVLVLLVVGW